MANLITASQHGQPLAEEVGKWTFSHYQDEFYIGEYYDTPEQAIAEAKAYYEEQGEQYETIFIAQVEEAEVPAPTFDWLAETIDDWLYDIHRIEDVSLFNVRDKAQHDLAKEQFEHDITAAIARYLTATNNWPKFFVFSDVREVKL